MENLFLATCEGARKLGGFPMISLERGERVELSRNRFICFLD